MVKKEPTFAQLQKSGMSVEEIVKKTVKVYKQESKVEFIRNWLIFWIGVTFFAMVLLGRVMGGNYLSNPNYYEKMYIVLFTISALMIYSSYVAGSSGGFPLAAYTSRGDAIAVEAYERKRMFEKVGGPIIGMLVGGVFVVLQYQFI